MRVNKYPNGYLPKIQYWTDQLQAELNRGAFADREELVAIMNKLNYFIAKEYNNFHTIARMERAEIKRVK